MNNDIKKTVAAIAGCVLLSSGYAAVGAFAYQYVQENKAEFTEAFAFLPDASWEAADETYRESAQSRAARRQEESEREARENAEPEAAEEAPETVPQQVQRPAPDVGNVQIVPQTDMVTAVVCDVTEVVKAAMPCVVAITNEYSAYDYWYDRMVEEEANGSGIIVGQNEEELWIVTNYHVVEDCNNLYVRFIDDSEVEAFVKGTAPDNDLAIVSVFLEDMDSDTLNAVAIAVLGDSDALQVGEPAIAIGNSLGYGQSVTTGVISALNRDVFADDPDINQGYLIQTDAAINPGNSGGALLNIRGEVIGINSSKIADYVIEGMGYAIPVATAKPIIEELIEQETRRKVSADKRAFLGISGSDVSGDAIDSYNMPEGVYVVRVVKGSAAEKAGILKGDIIIEIDGEEITSMTQLQGVLEYYTAGTQAEVVVMRQEQGEYIERTMNVVLQHNDN
ncbi:MAG: trypsin-like peptidase domain-containing protein [Roseburia sp.]|nr:trypsin-like peptidase domain-containing protein [Roseburia sp.]